MRIQTQLLQHGLVAIILLSTILSANFAAGADTSQAANINERFDSISFEQGYSIIWGQPNISEDGSKVQLKLDKHSGSGFVSHDDYFHGFFSASIKLPAGNTAGVVIAFYTSNGDAYPENHDELDFEFLGNLPGKGWGMQTNVYGNGSVARGREERFKFWFDPTADFHNYSILWNHKHIVFMVDNIPIREMTRTEALTRDYPSKPMALYATIWDGSGWATNGGKYPVDYKFAPFVASFTDLKLEGCAADPIDRQSDRCQQGLEHVNPAKLQDLLALNSDQKAMLEWVRSNHLYYSYCDDKRRYPVPLPECSSESSYRSILRGKRHKSHPRRSSHSSRSGGRGRTLIENTHFPSIGTVDMDAHALFASHPRFPSVVEFTLPTSLRVPYTRAGKIPKASFG